LLAVASGRRRRSRNDPPSNGSRVQAGRLDLPLTRLPRAGDMRTCAADRELAQHLTQLRAEPVANRCCSSFERGGRETERPIADASPCAPQKLRPALQSGLPA
jgi:hypothetical protein